MDRADIYHSDPDILGGTPVFAGTRVPIDTLLVYLRREARTDASMHDVPALDAMTSALPLTQATA